MICHLPESNVLCSLVSSLYYGLEGGVALFLTQDLLPGATTLSLKVPSKKGLGVAWVWHECKPSKWPILKESVETQVKLSLSLTT